MAQTYGYLKALLVAAPWLQRTPKRNSNEVQYHVRATLSVTAADGSTQTWDSATNVGTTLSTDLLQYKLVFDFAHPVTQQLSDSLQGFQDLTGANVLPALDFLRSDILAGTGPWRQTDPMDGSTQVEPVASLLRLLTNAQTTGAPVYLFGHSYTHGGLGVHDIHMNQGSTGHYLDPVKSPDEHNAIWQDGALLVDLGPGQWAAYVSAFNQQLVPTDDGGNPLPSGHTIAVPDEGSLR